MHSSWTGKWVERLNNMAVHRHHLLNAKLKVKMRFISVTLTKIHTCNRFLCGMPHKHWFILLKSHIKHLHHAHQMLLPIFLLAITSNCWNPQIKAQNNKYLQTLERLRTALNTQILTPILFLVKNNVLMLFWLQRETDKCFKMQRVKYGFKKNCDLQLGEYNPDLLHTPLTIFQLIISVVCLWQL